ncbi:MAG: phosphatase PAP2 family protein [Elusimicrobia bacterium]|nr:phosphatase PAP2 family protein [Elusimicrobiota bacterium]
MARSARGLLGLLPALVLCSCAPRPVPRSAPKPFYVSAEPFRSWDFPPPPAPGSAAQKDDIAVVLYWQKTRTQADCAKADAAAIVDYAWLWGDRSPFAAPHPAEVKEFFARLDSDTRSVLGVMKDRFRRPRPHDAYVEAQPCIRKSRSPAYPSGHAAYARIFADVLADIVPERRDEFLARADEIGHYRVLGGVHYPADIAAGKRLGDELHARLMASPAYMRDLARMRALRGGGR